MVDWHRNTHPTRTGGEHIPSQPFWVAIVRGVQALFNIIVLALAANAASFIYGDAYGMAFFTFAWTVLFLLYIFLAPRFAPHLYHYWGHVAAESLTVLWWLVTFALLANYTRNWDYYARRYRNEWIDSTRAACAFAVLNWLLFCVTLVALIFLNRGANVDSAHTTTHTGSGFNLKSIFSRKPAAATDVEKNQPGATNGGQPVELNDRDGHVAGNGYNNGVGAGHNGYNNGTQGPPPAADAPHYPAGEPNRY